MRTIKAYMPKRKRVEVQRRVNGLHRLRNRVAHHEPIYRENLATRHRELVEVVGWIDGTAAQWLAGTCDRLLTLLAGRP